MYAPVQEDGRSVHDAFDFFMRPPYFPVTLNDLGGVVTFTDVVERGARDRVAAQVMARLVPHCGPTLGYRVTWDGVSVAYLSDHQQPPDGSHRVSDGALELCQGADLVIHDAEYTPVEFQRKSTWGHCTVEYAVRVAHQAGAKRLALFHHDPLRDDDALDDLASESKELVSCLGLELMVAAGGPHRLAVVSAAR